MTREMARQEAERRWGKGGWIAYALRYYTVGNTGTENRRICQGGGGSWSQAFKDADKKAGQ